MDIASDISSQTRLKLKKIQQETKHQANVVVNDVMQQVSLRKRVEPTEAEVVARNAAQIAADQINYNNMRKSILDKIAEHKMKVQQSAQLAAAKVAQRFEARQIRHQNFLADEKKRFEQRKAKNNAAIRESIKSGL